MEGRIDINMASGGRGMPRPNSRQRVPDVRFGTSDCSGDVWEVHSTPTKGFRPFSLIGSERHRTAQEVSQGTHLPGKRAGSSNCRHRRIFHIIERGLVPSRRVKKSPCAVTVGFLQRLCQRYLASQPLTPLLGANEGFAEPLVVVSYRNLLSKNKISIGMSFLL